MSGTGRTGKTRTIESVRETWRKLLVTVLAIALYRAGSAIPLPTVRPEALNFISTTRYSAIWQQFGGNPLSSVSIMALGVVPYVTATLVLQLLSGIIPALAKLQEDSEGRARFRKVTVTTALVLAVAQAVVTVLVFRQTRAMIGVTINPGLTNAVVTAVFLTLGFVLVLLLADVITRYGVGSGVSVILLTTVLSSTVSLLKRALPLSSTAEILLTSVITLVAITLSVVGLRTYRSIRLYSTELGIEERTKPIEMRAHILQGGIAPIVFAGSILGLLGGISGRLINQEVGATLGGAGMIGACLFALLIAGFTRLHMRLTLDPVKTANDLVKSGYFIEATAPGWKTADRLAGIGSSAAVSIALLLLPLALLPAVSSAATGGLSSFIGVSSLLLATGVTVDVLREWDSGTRRLPQPPAIVGGGTADPWAGAPVG